MPPVKVHHGELIAVVPVVQTTTVSALLSSALARVGAEQSEDDPLELTLASDHRAVLHPDDAVLDVLESTGGKLEDVAVVPRSFRASKRQKRNEAAPFSSQPSEAAPCSRVAEPTGEGPLEVQWAFLGEGCGSTRVHPAQTSLADLAALIASRCLAASDAKLASTSIELYAEEGYPLGSSGHSKDLPLVQLGWPANGAARCYVVHSSGPCIFQSEPTGTADPKVGSVQFFVRGDRTFGVFAELEDSVLTLKMKIKSKQGWPVHRQRLSFSGRVLRDNDVSLRDVRTRVLEPRVTTSLPLTLAIALILSLSFSLTRRRASSESPLFRSPSRHPHPRKT